MLLLIHLSLIKHLNIIYIHTSYIQYIYIYTHIIYTVYMYIYTYTHTHTREHSAVVRHSEAVYRFFLASFRGSEESLFSQNVGPGSLLFCNTNRK